MTRNASSDSFGFRFQPTSFSEASITISTEAGGPAATTRSTRSGTYTFRPAESMTSRAEAAASEETELRVLSV